MATTVGFIGTGFIARFHAGSLSVCGVPFDGGPCFDVEAGKAEAFGADFGYSPVGSSDAVLEGCDAVYITTWTSEHGALVDAAVARGIHVFVEKPLALDAAGADAIARACESAGVVAQVGLILRRSPTFGLARELLRDPAAGRPMAVVFRDDQFIPIRGMYGSEWRADRTKAGAGTLIEHSIHDLDLLDWMLGPTESVACQTSSFHGLDGIEDVASATLRFANGATATLMSVWHDIDERPSQRLVELFSEKLYVRIESEWEGPIAYRFDGDAAETVLIGPDVAAEARRRGARVGNQDGSFLRAIRDATPASPTPRDAVRAHQLVDAAYASAAAGGAPIPV